MSDVMLLGVLRMPHELAMADDLSRSQCWSRAAEAADRIEADAERVAALQSRLARYEQPDDAELVDNRPAVPVPAVLRDVSARRAIAGPYRLLAPSVRLLGRQPPLSEGRYLLQRLRAPRTYGD